MRKSAKDTGATATPPAEQTDRRENIRRRTTQPRRNGAREIITSLDRLPPPRGNEERHSRQFSRINRPPPAERIKRKSHPPPPAVRTATARQAKRAEVINPKRPQQHHPAAVVVTASKTRSGTRRGSDTTTPTGKRNSASAERAARTEKRAARGYRGQGQRALKVVRGRTPRPTKHSNRRECREIPAGTVENIVR